MTERELALEAEYSDETAVKEAAQSNIKRDTFGNLVAKEFQLKEWENAKKAPSPNPAPPSNIDKLAAIGLLIYDEDMLWSDPEAWENREEAIRRQHEDAVDALTPSERAYLEGLTETKKD